MVVSQQITQADIDNLVDEAQRTINLVKNKLQYHLDVFQTYTWIDLRPGNDQHLRSRLITWIEKFSNYEVDPELINLAGRENLDPLCVKKSKLTQLIAFTGIMEELFDSDNIKQSNDNLLIALGDLINRYVAADGFIPQN